MYNFELEKGSKKYNCPACSQKTFVRYIDKSAAENLSFDVGRCDRESKCGYHQTPKEYFAVNPSARESRAFVGTQQKRGISNYAAYGKNGTRAKCEAETQAKKPDYIDNEIFQRTLTNYDQNSFVCFLLKLFPTCRAEINQAVKDYLIGTTKDGKTIFWQIDQRRKVRTGKIIAYDIQTGKRRKDVFPNWIHSELKKRKLLNEDFNLKQCFFGTHLLSKYQNKSVCIVEAEKTAVIAALCFPEFVWLAAGSKQSLRPEKLKFLKARKIILYPDGDAFDLWTGKASDAARFGVCVKVSSLIENHATDEEKADGYDLADYLIQHQTRINEHNDFANKYNAALEKVLRDDDLFDRAVKDLETQKGNLILFGGLCESEAEKQAFDFANIRRTVSKTAERQN